jgi:hypothetical protein
MISRIDFEALLKTLARDQRVNLGVGDADRRGWFRAQVVSHDAVDGRLVLTYVMDRPSDRPLEPGQRVIVSAIRMDDSAQSAPMKVAHSAGGPQPTVELSMDGVWQPEEDRRHQARVPLQIHPKRARRWVGGAWRDLGATVVDLSSRGVGLNLDHEARVGDRLSLVVPLDDGGPDLKVTLEIRHVRPHGRVEGTWRAGGLFRNLDFADHERVIRFIFAELRSRQ